MTEKEFIDYINQGYNLIPLSLSIENSNIDPIDVYELLSDKPKTYLFESLEGNKDWSRYTIIGLPSDEYIEIHQNTINHYKNDDKINSLESNDPISWIEEFQAGFKAIQDPSLPNFQGGLVGFFGFDTVQYFEPTLNFKLQDDLMKTPDICLMVSREILIFDKINNLIHILVYADNSIESYKSCSEKIEGLKKYLINFESTGSTNDPSTQDVDIKIHHHFEKKKFIKSIDKIKRYIVNGDAMQVVLSQRMSLDFQGKPISFYRELRELNPSPYMYYLNMGDYYIVGSSPEILVRLEDGLITVRPIAGTRPRGINGNQDSLFEEELLNDPKERAEHLMLIDLGRNDAGKVSKIGSIKLTDTMIIEKYSHVMHMVSNVTGELSNNLGMIDVLKSTFPAGTVSGAPKMRAIEIIYEQEDIKRGIYAGAVGYLGWNGNMDTAIAIRTSIIKNDKLYIQCGAGIVNDSIAELEWEETMNKGKAIIQAYKNLRKKNI
jgi:anthranilate synthase component 1